MQEYVSPTTDLVYVAGQVRHLVLFSVFFFQIGCCGAKGSEDYNDALKPVPQECRDPTTGIEYR